MSCQKPLRGIYKGIDSNGKKILKIVPFDATTSEAFKEGTKYYELPCGHCAGCREDQAKEWSNRLLMEYQYNKDAWFITLTYSPYYEFETYRDGVDLETGEYKKQLSVKKEHVQKFMKRLRKRYKEQKLRFFCASEYGEKDQRPHYHLIIFGLRLDQYDPDDRLIFYKNSKSGEPLYRMKSIEDCWSDPKDRRLNKDAMEKGLSPNLIGYVTIAPANMYTFMYVSQYVIKKTGYKPNLVYEMEGREPPFSLSSRKPGIGLQYYEDHKDEMTDDGFFYLPSPDGVVKVRPPNYFKKKFREYNPDRAEEISEKHLKIAAAVTDTELLLTDLSQLEYYRVKGSSPSRRPRDLS